MTDVSSQENLIPRSRTRRRQVLDAATARLFKMPRGRHDYTLTEAVPVPMRDGVELLTDVYAPVGKSQGTVLVRTPYGRSGVIAAITARYYASHGYHAVNQGCRGTFGSGGDFEPFRREIDDGADTVAWLRQQPWFGGRFALVGASYLGFTAWAIMTDPPPELACAVIAVSAHDNHWATHGHGVFSLEPTLSLCDSFAHHEEGPLKGVLRVVTAERRLRPGFEELPLVRAQETVLAGSTTPYRNWLTARSAEDPEWQPVRLGQALERTTVPVLLQEGWQDRFVDQMTYQYQRLRRRGVDVALTIGPWTHVEAATKGFGIINAETLDWLEEHLAGTGHRRRSAPVRVFVAGAGEWRDLPEWPPESREKVLFLHPDGGLGDSPPAPTAGSSTFTYDPSDPTPSVGGRVINPTRAGYRDNHRLEQRDDVLTFTTAPLVDPVEVIGAPVVELVHRTDNPYADFFLRLCEVDGNGKSVNISDAISRLEPEKSSGTIRLELDAIAHRFQAGRRIRLQVSGGAHPRYARNLGTDEDPATSVKMAPSRRTVCHGDGGLSRVLLPCPV